MLVEFSATNFRSIKERTTLSLVATAGSEHRETHVCRSAAPSTPDLLRSVVIFGPNASGKSNLLRAMDEMEEMVRESSKERQRGQHLPYEPFAADRAAKLEPTEFEAIFVENDVRYQYGFEYNKTTIVREWLYAYPEGRQQKWFERVRSVSGEEQWSFGPNLKGKKKTWQESTRANSLFLSTATQLNSEQLQPVFDWFNDRFRALKKSSPAAERFTTGLCAKEGGGKDLILAFFKAADIPISDISVEKKKLDPNIIEHVPEDLREFAQEQIAAGLEIQSTKLLHKSEQGSEMWLDLDEESDGTQRLFTLAGPWIDTLQSGYILTVDELDASLHPSLLRFLVRIFHDPTMNTKNAQLIFTTHDTSILDKDLLRRDQVWFMEKDQMFASHLFPLTEFSPRKDESLEKGYLQGRYGALPVFNADLIF